jgi:hypothetical protein
MVLILPKKGELILAFFTGQGPGQARPNALELGLGQRTRARCGGRQNVNGDVLLVPLGLRGDYSDYSWLIYDLLHMIDDDLL